jgi:hypothetical protein
MTTLKDAIGEAREKQVPELTWVPAMVSTRLLEVAQEPEL